MTRLPTRLTLGVLALALASACKSELTAPDPAEQPVALSAQTRTALSGERLPDVRVTGAAGRVEFEVARESMCASLVEGRMGVRGTEITLVTTVGLSPSLACTLPAPWVLEYSGTVPGLARGRYTVHVWEIVPGNNPTRLHTATVDVGAP